MYRQIFKFDHPLSSQGRSALEVLQARSLQMRETINKEIDKVLDSGDDENTYISSVVNRFRIEIPQFDFDVDHITKTEKYENRQTSDVFGQNASRKAWVVTFGFPYKGQLEFLRYIPHARASLSMPEFTFDSQYMHFSTWVWDQPEKDVQSIKAEKEKAMAFLQKRVADVTPELEQFNQVLPGDARGIFDAQKQKRLKDKDTLAQL